ncbi:hypothetical protein K1719_032480 [Acacia pycnantha]|nr:hypothetical protein K1719_032480 [Acacia pycnantha]
MAMFIRKFKKFYKKNQSFRDRFQKRTSSNRREFKDGDQIVSYECEKPDIAALSVLTEWPRKRSRRDSITSKEGIYVSPYGRQIFDDEIIRTERDTRFHLAFIEMIEGINPLTDSKNNRHKGAEKMKNQRGSYEPRRRSPQMPRRRPLKPIPLRELCVNPQKDIRVSATVLHALFNASSASDSLFEVAAIVTQPPARRDRGKKLLPSPLAKFALDRGQFLVKFEKFATRLMHCCSIWEYTAQQVSKHTTIGLDNFLSNLRSLQPDLRITAAYGNILPSKFLNIPPFGSKVLVRELPSLFDGSAKVKAQPQDHNKATFAPKINPEESWLSFDQEALVLHNKVSFLILPEL